MQHIDSIQSNSVEELLFTLAGEQKELALYIHVPFCAQRCDYCSFFSTTNNSSKDIEVYTNCIAAQIRKIVDFRKKRFSTIFIGGGNPGLLTAKQIITILHAAGAAGRADEISLECNPENLDRGILELLNSGAIDRLSMGIQSVTEEILTYLGRNCAHPDNYKRTAALLHSDSFNQSGKHSWQLNIDLITNVPGQSIQTAKMDIKKSIELFKPQHISLYELTLEPETPLYKKIFDHNSTGEFQTGFNTAALWDYLESLGYKQYEISNFYKADNENSICRHNVGYWKMKSYIGLGTSAVSTMFSRKGNIYRFEGISDIKQFVDAEHSNNERYIMEEISQYDYMIEKIIMETRLVQGLSLSQFEKIFSISIEKLSPKTIETGVVHNNIKNENGYLYFTKKGLLISNHILVEMIKEIEENRHLFSNTIDLTALFELW